MEENKNVWEGEEGEMEEEEEEQQQSRGRREKKERRKPRRKKSSHRWESIGQNIFFKTPHIIFRQNF